ncbi:hypothetical protein C6500_02870 [Candidatus Poribacteria bacterium]|nr:MAG: hypothetical protein C6500_02870 [Candidatus Poribacteria bacterium]
MPHKVSSLLCFVVFIFMFFLPEGYSQTQTEQSVSLKEQQEGRTLLVAASTLYGLSLYGPGTAILLDLESGSQLAGVELLMGGGSFVGALMATKNHRLGVGRSNLILSGSFAGTFYGFGVPVLLESENPKAYFASAMLATPIGGLITHRLTDHRWFKKGESYLMTNGGFVGGLYGFAIPYIANIENLEEQTQAKIYVASMMAGVPIGAWTTTKLIYNKPISEGRSHIISFGGLIGSAYANGIVSLLDVEASRAYVLASMVGLPAAAYLGYRLTTEGEYTAGRAALIQIGACAGALFGNGFVLLTEAESHKPYVVAGILGSAAGMWFAHRATRGWGEKTPFTRNDLIPKSDRFAVSVPSIDKWLTLGLMAFRKPTFMADFPVELLRISF